MIDCVVGARPNFMKMAPVVAELARRGIPHRLIHTGQHYDDNMSEVFFTELGLPRPDIHLEIERAEDGASATTMMSPLGKIFRERRPGLVVVAGDVASTLAASVAAAAEGIALAHVEAGLRSFDLTMPEEFNRIVADHLSQLLFTTEESANQNLRREGIRESSVHFVGNCMVDSLMKHLPSALEFKPWQRFGLEPSAYALLTLHRPSNVDREGPLMLLAGVMNEVSGKIPVLFPVHPRTRERFERVDFKPSPRFLLTEPLPYLVFLGLMAKAKFVMTDSGGVQEETTFLRVPCLTLRRNTERPVTTAAGTNRVIGNGGGGVLKAVEAILTGKVKEGSLPELWDGHAARRIVDRIEAWASRR